MDFSSPPAGWLQFKSREGDIESTNSHISVSHFLSLDFLICFLVLQSSPPSVAELGTLCSRGSSSWRSLGGQMRSRLTNSSAEKKPPKASPTTGYGHGLRKKPKKTRRALELDGDQSSIWKTCRECGRRFGTWKVLLGHMMKCHLVDNSDSLEEEKEEEDGEFDSRDSQFWCRDGADHHVVDNSQSSDNETVFQNQKKRSQRRKSYGATKLANSSSSFQLPAIEPELEEVAMCLMMLSRDLSMADSLDNHSVPMPLQDGDSHSLQKRVNGKSEPSDSGSLNNWFRANQDELNQSKVEIMEMGSGKNSDGMNENQVKARKVSSSLSKRKFSNISDVSRVRRSSSKKSLASDGLELEVDQDLNKERSRFECDICNKIFHSYQALGGHRASHRKSKVCFGSKVNSNGTQSFTEAITTDGTETETIGQLKRKKENKGDDHECPICLRVFPSGQALGGHKRSHISDAKNGRTRLPAIREPTPVHEIRDFLDLNLPAPLEEEEEISSTISFRHWRVRRSHKQEAVIGLATN